MAKNDEQVMNTGHHEGVTGIIDGCIQDEPDKVKNEERSRSLSISVGNGRGLIVISEVDRRHYSDPLPEGYKLFAIEHGVDGSQMSIVLAESEIHALIGTLQKIIEKENDGINLETGNGIAGIIQMNYSG